jgi:cathepsin B
MRLALTIVLAALACATLDALPAAHAMRLTPPAEAHPSHRYDAAASFAASSSSQPQQPAGPHPHRQFTGVRRVDPYLPHLRRLTPSEHVADVEADLRSGKIVDTRTMEERANDALAWAEQQAEQPLSSDQRAAFLTAEVARLTANPYAYSVPPAAWDPRASPFWSAVCPSIMNVRDQGDCDADWAATVASAWSDRLCKQTNGTYPTGQAKDISVEDILSCCGWKCGLGCNGGYSTLAWNYIAERGAVTGSGYNTTGLAGGCLPYTLSPCHLTDVNGTVRACDAFPGQTETPVCPNPPTCRNGQDWEEAKYKSDPPYVISSGNSTIESEIYYYGSVTATIDIYKDFFIQNLRSVYQCDSGYDLVGSLTIKLLGYGVWSGVQLWIASPTWGSNWGPQNGFFWIARRTGQCNVEAEVIGARAPKKP